MIYLTKLADKLGIDPVEATKAKVTINGQCNVLQAFGLRSGYHRSAG
jgi:hypothetical protein